MPQANASTKTLVWNTWKSLFVIELLFSILLIVVLVFFKRFSIPYSNIASWFIVISGILYSTKRVPEIVTKRFIVDPKNIILICAYVIGINLVIYIVSYCLQFNDQIPLRGYQIITDVLREISQFFLLFYWFRKTINNN